jgi:hypothetical protein
MINNIRWRWFVPLWAANLIGVFLVCASISWAFKLDILSLPLMPPIVWIGTMIASLAALGWRSARVQREAEIVREFQADIRGGLRCGRCEGLIDPRSDHAKIQGLPLCEPCAKHLQIV